VSQELSIVPTATVAENVFLGSKRSRFWRRRKLAEESRPYLQRLGLDQLDPSAPATTLTVAEGQLVEIARVLARDARVVIFDEPTASLTDREIERVGSVVRSLSADGWAVLYVTHRLGEVKEFCDSALILRNGVGVAQLPVATTSMDEIVAAMLGRAVGSLFPEPGQAGEVVLEASQVEGHGLVDPVDLKLKAGEITGLASQIGGGATALLRILAGFDPVIDGTMRLGGEEIKHHSPRRAVSQGIVYASNDRKRDGFFPGRTVAENLTSLSLPAVSQSGWLSKRREHAFAVDAAAFLNLDPSRVRSMVENLSGGNQQKVVLGKIACRDPRPKVLLLDEPTRGVDIGARVEIYRLLRRLADDGMAIAFVSSDVGEVVGLSDKVVTFFRGRQTGVLRREEATERQVVVGTTHLEEGVAGGI
jgi:ABC-type sugar transport system ATPase subunit